MSPKPRPLLDDIATIYHHASASYDGERCCVAPSPELRQQMKQQLAQLRGQAGGRLAGLLRMKDITPPGMNDGLIYPGSEFPAGTPTRIVREAAAARAPLRGTLRVVVVLAQFSDRAMAQTNQHFQDLFFSTGVLPNGSVREYYRDVTNNLIDIVGDVLGPYTLPLTLAQYAHGDSGTGPALPNARTMALDAATAADPNVNFAPYDNDGDGYVDAFIVIHAGPSAESTGNTGDIWSHKWVLPGGAYNADGTKIYAYLTVGEDARIGVCCHELGHLLFGFPDLYDTDYSGEGVGNWCLMGGGSWNSGGDVPAHPSAWCKANQGWASVINQTTNATVNITAVETGRTIYRLWKDGAPGSEYFLVENRQQVGYDGDLPSGGLLIWHIDEAIASNADENHPKVALMQADGQRDLEQGNNRGDRGDPYPGTANNTAFTSTSTPHSKSYPGADTCVAVTGIGPSGATMTATLSVKCVVKRKEGIKDVKDKDFKDRIKDFKEIKEFKEKDKEFKEKDKEFKEKDKDFEKPGEGGGVGRQIPEQGLYGAASIEARVATLEARMSVIEPFIDASLRPDLREGALAGEEDIERTRTPLREGTPQSKRLIDSKQREW